MLLAVRPRMFSVSDAEASKVLTVRPRAETAHTYDYVRLCGKSIDYA